MSSAWLLSGLLIRVIESGYFVMIFVWFRSLIFVFRVVIEWVRGIDFMIFVWFRSLYDWMLDLSRSRHAEKALALMSFCSSIFFPIPQDVMLVPMCLAERSRCFRYAFIASLFSVLGGIVAYGLGYFLYQTVALPILQFYSHQEAMANFLDYYNEYGGFVVFLGGMTPIPYKVIALLSGASQLSFIVFIVASAFGRVVRFFGIAFLIYWFGAPVKRFIEAYFSWFCVVIIVVLVGGYIVFELLLM